MSTWVLVLMLSFSRGGVGIEQVDGFQTREACEREGAAVMAAWEKSATVLPTRGGAFHCVELRWDEGE